VTNDKTCALHFYRYIFLFLLCLCGVVCMACRTVNPQGLDDLADQQVKTVEVVKEITKTVTEIKEIAGEIIYMDAPEPVKIKVREIVYFTKELESKIKTLEASLTIERGYVEKARKELALIVAERDKLKTDADKVKRARNIAVIIAGILSAVVILAIIARLRRFFGI